MTKKLVTLCGAALALLLVSSLSGPADARRGGHGGHGGHHFHGHHHGGHAHRFHHRHVHRFHHHHRFHRHRHAHLFVVPYVYGYSDNGCYWLRQRALYTGSPYWWNRYYSCIYGSAY